MTKTAVNVSGPLYENITGKKNKGQGHSLQQNHLVDLDVHGY